MDDELIIRQDGVVSLIENGEIGDVLKPLIKEIHLFDSFVAGTTHLKDTSVLSEIKIGDKRNFYSMKNEYYDITILEIIPEKEE